MKAAIFNGPGAVEAGERPDPVIQEPTDAVVRVVRGCVCGSDLWYYRGVNKHAVGSIGHEFIGTIEAVGDEVSNLAPGDFVIAPFTYSKTLFWRNVGIKGGVAPARHYIPELLGDVLAGRINPGRIFDFETDLDHVAVAYAAMDERRAIKSLILVGAVR
jgi:threonine dehydrogenase-like Zn-dependent dehydrogenase